MRGWTAHISCTHATGTGCVVAVLSAGVLHDRRPGYLFTVFLAGHFFLLW